MAYTRPSDEDLDADFSRRRFKWPLTIRAPLLFNDFELYVNSITKKSGTASSYMCGVRYFFECFTYPEGGPHGWKREATNYLDYAR